MVTKRWGAGERSRQKERRGPGSEETEGVMITRGIRFMRNLVILVFEEEGGSESDWGFREV
jgi:hypothetical protein